MSKNPEKMKINGTTAVPVAFIPVVAKAVLSSGRTVARLDLVAFAWCFLKVIVEFKSNKSKMQRQQSQGENGALNLYCWRSSF